MNLIKLSIEYESADPLIGVIQADHILAFAALIDLLLYQAHSLSDKVDSLIVEFRIEDVKRFLLFLGEVPYSESNAELGQCDHIE